MKAVRFSRKDFGLGPLEPPFVIRRVNAGLFHTQEGLLVDRCARVLRADGTPVPNMFAGGGAAAGVSGRSGGAGYVSGNGLLAASVLGYIAGETAAVECHWGALAASTSQVLKSARPPDAMP